MEIGIVGTGNCFPPRAGGAVRVFQIMKHLGELGCSVHLFSFDYESSFRLKNVKVHHCEELRPPHWSLEASDIRKELVSVAKFMRRTRCLEQLDIIQSEGIPTTPHILMTSRLLRKPSVLDEHNVYTILCHRLSRPARLCKRIHFLENLACRSVDRILTVSRFDKQMIQGFFRVDSSKVSVAPNGVDAQHYAPNSETRERIRLKYNLDDKPVILFTGLLNYFPNEDALRVLITEVYPKVKKLSAEAVFMIVGPYPPPWLLEQKSADLIVTGAVEDVAPFINASDICIAPLRLGSGTRIKVLEYMALGRPVVSTSIGVEGLDVTNQKQVIVENNWARFAKWIVTLATNKELSNRIGRNARLLAQTKYDWKQIVGKMITTYREML